MISALYRFVQEGLNNSFRHAGGQGQAVYVKVDAKALVVEVRDKGQGVPQSSQSHEALGLLGMRSRVEALGGRFSVESSERGMVVTAAFDLRDLEACDGKFDQHRGG
jgi:signal transduction histidine kinase